MTPRTRRRLYLLGAGLLVVVAVAIWLFGPKQRCEITGNGSDKAWILQKGHHPTEGEIKKLVIETAKDHGFYVTEGEYSLKYTLSQSSWLEKRIFNYRVFFTLSHVDSTGRRRPSSVFYYWDETLFRPYLLTGPTKSEEFIAFRESIAQKIQQEFGQPLPSGFENK